MLTYTIPEEITEAKYKYIYEKIKQDIIHGTLKPEEKLPSKRSLAEHLGVSIITIENAYQLLIEEGYVIPRERSGYFVLKWQPLHKGNEVKKRLPADDPERRAERTNAAEMYSFSAAHFPLSEYRKVMRAVLSEHEECLLTKSPSFGCDVLRRELADYLKRYRGIEVDMDQIIIGSGSEYLYGLLVLFLGREKIYGLEDPSFEKIRQVYEANGAVCEMLPMDSSGISTQALEKTRAAVLHVTPFHSYPTGITATAQKRFEYLRWAGEREGIIIEDDIDSEFAVGSKPMEPIFSMDREDRVIYMNTFSRSMTPAVRTAYLLLPKSMVKAFAEKLSFHSCTVPTYQQYVLAEFIREGYFERHLNRLRRRLRAQLHRNCEP